MSEQPSGVISNKPLPAWAKVIIALMVLSFASTLALCIVAYVWVYPQFLNSTKPDNINKVAAHIAVFSPYPPPDYKFTTGLEFFNIYTLIAEHVPDQQSTFIISYPIIQGDPSTIVNNVSSNGLQNTQMGAHFNSITSKGELAVAHEKMPYVIGTISDHDRICEAMFGCLVSGKSKRTVCVLALTPSGKHFSFKAAVELLESVEKFN